jgi:hypothetical protein
MERTNILRGQNEVSNFKTGDTYRKHCAFLGYMLGKRVVRTHNVDYITEINNHK